MSLPSSFPRVRPTCRRRLTVLLLAGVCGALSAQTAPTPPAGRPGELPDAGFEANPTRWDLDGAAGLARLAPEAAFEGGKGLRLESPGDDRGALVASARIPVQPGVTYRLSWQGRVVAGDGTNVYLRFFDADGRELLREEGRVNAAKDRKWAAASLDAVPPTSAVTMDVAIQRPPWRPPSYVIDLDAFALRAQPLALAAPWPGTYKLRPAETARLTAADVIGPDGRVYPDFTWAGVPGGIPQAPVVVRLAELGATPGGNVTAVLEAAAARVAAQGGGAILLGEGDYVLDEPVMIFGNRVTIRGAGPEKTRLLFRYHIPFGEIRFFRLKPGQELAQNSTIEFHANPKNLVALELRAGNQTLDRRVRQDHWGNTFSLRVSGAQALGKLGEGPHVFTAIAEYDGGPRVEKSIELRLTRGWNGEPAPAQLGAVNFVGRGIVAGPVLLQADGRRGRNALTLAAGHGLVPGDKISLVAPASERWKTLAGHNSSWGIQAQNLHEITAVAGDRVTLNQPLRADFLRADGSFAQKVQVIQGSGLEGLSLEQEVVPGQGPRGPVIGTTLWHAIDDLWTNGVSTSFAWGCWLKNVTVKNTGRNAAYFVMSKHIEARDCLFDEAIFKGGGGTGYVGFDRSWDCLLDTIEVRGMRHAPNSQWNSSGNVVRRSRFLGSDGQWHAGWTLENLYEQNFIDSRGDGGSYGHGLYASGPSSGLHGPQGPRNVVYNNDIVSRKDGLFMLGGNEGWLILFNRFDVGSGRAVYAKEKSFDHILAGNVFILRQEVSPTVVLGSDAVGVELIDNQFYGTRPPLVGFAGGRTRLARDQGNVLVAEIPEPLPPRPQPKVASIYQWQRDHEAQIRARREALLAPPPTPTPSPAPRPATPP